MLLVSWAGRTAGRRGPTSVGSQGLSQGQGGHCWRRSAGQRSGRRRTLASSLLPVQSPPKTFIAGPPAGKRKWGTHIRSFMTHSRAGTVPSSSSHLRKSLEQGRILSETVSTDSSCKLLNGALGRQLFWGEGSPIL